jgi:hypothetical protein
MEGLFFHENNEGRTMKTMMAASILLALNSAHAATQTVDCGRLLDVQQGTWRERVSIVIENGSIVSVGP